MSEHIKWTKTYAFHNVVKAVRGAINAGASLPTQVVYRAKVKLHGTNAGIRVDPDGTVTAQSRNRDLTTDDDNAGFAAWVESHRDRFTALARVDRPFVVYGGWCGRGIMKSCAIHQVKGPVLAVFAVQMGDEERAHVWQEPTEIAQVLRLVRDLPALHILPWHGETVRVDFCDHGTLAAAVDCITPAVDRVEACDPWVRDTFGKEGVGEGLVYFPVNVRPARSVVTRLLFKAKGEKHRVNHQKKAVQIDPEVAASVEAFVDMMVTEARCEQAVAEACGGEYDKRHTGAFLRWVGNDVRDEGAAELEASGLEWGQVAKACNTRARDWFFAAKRRLSAPEAAE